MKKLIGLIFFLISLPMGAQEMRWENVTALNFVVTGGADKENALQQYLLFDESVMDRNRELFEQYKTFAQEFGQMSLNSEVPQFDKELDEMTAKVKQMMKDHPELADELKKSLKEVEMARGEYFNHVDNEVKEYTYDPKEILRKMTSIAVNQRTYTAYKDIGGGLFAVKTGACYGPLELDAFKRVQTPEKNEYTWGAIKYDGNVIMKPIYKGFNLFNEDLDIIFLETKDAKGKVSAGARGYDGRVRIPFDYDSYDYWAKGANDEGICPFSKNGKTGFVTFDNKVLLPFEFTKAHYDAPGWIVSKDGKNLGVVDTKQGRLVIPCKYKYFWDCSDGVTKMQRFDRKIDVYDNNSYQLIRTEPEPQD